MHHDLIVFAEDWGGLPSSTQHIIKLLAKTRKVVWINSIGLRQPSLTGADIKRLWQKLTAVNVNNTKTHNKANDDTRSANHFHIINPRTLPAPRSAVARYIAQQLLLLQIKPIIKKAKLINPILWTSLPTAVDFAGCFDECALVYYCGDDFSGLAGVDHNTVAQREKELSTKADLIMVSSENLLPRFPTSHTQLLTHGVDYRLFSSPTQRALDLPNKETNIAGFYGSISAWLDIELLHATILKMPHWQFVFIGKAVVDISRLSALKNVTFLGERAHHLLPSYSQHWTASLLPFVDNAQIQACNPLKLKEYLAAGRPIVCTDFSAIHAHRGLVQIANSSDAMVEALTNCEHLQQLESFTPTLRNRVVDKNWESRAQQVAKWMDRL